MNARTAIVAAAVLALATGCRKKVVATPNPAAAQGLAGAHVVSVAPEDDGQWTMASKDYSNTRYSRLHQIDTTNVKNLTVAWTFDTKVEKGHEEAPLVVGDTMFIVTPYPNRVFALDLKKPGGEPKWIYESDPSPAAQGEACCDVVNRGLAYADGRLFLNRLDAWTVALDAQTGKEIWKTKLGDVSKGETMTMAPLVVKDKVFVGNSGGEMGVRGWLTALDTATGAIAWRAWTTGPDADVLIGPEFKPFYASDRGKDLGVQSWPPDQWRIGGGTVWGFLSYDPDLDLLYYGTSNPGPWNPEVRPGDNKWTAGAFARRASDGHAFWWYGFNPHDEHDYDGVNEMVLVDLEMDAKLRKVAIHPDRNGYVYLLDRTSGEVLSAAPFGEVTSSNGVDLATGKLAIVHEKSPALGKTVRDICPASPGAKDWQPSAFSYRTKLLYIPHQNLCQDEEGLEASYVAGTPYVGANVHMKPGPGGHRGLFDAWDPVQGKKVWSIKEDLPVWSGTLVTEGDVAFYGTMDGWFKAVDARTGTELWKTKTDSGIIGQPVTYRGPDGKQYVAVAAGVGGWAGAVVAGALDPRDPTAALGFAGATADLPSRTKVGGKIYAFALP